MVPPTFANFTNRTIAFIEVVVFYVTSHSIMKMLAIPHADTTPHYVALNYTPPAYTHTARPLGMQVRSYTAGGRYTGAQIPAFD